MPDNPHTSTSTPGTGGSKNVTSTTIFTPEMRDRQARGKNPYNSESEDSDEGVGDGLQRVGTPRRDERFAVHDRRRMAAQVLNSHELLMMAAVRDKQSIPATRLKYSRALCGLRDEPSSVTIRTPATTAASEEQGRPRPNPEKG